MQYVLRGMGHVLPIFSIGGYLLGLTCISGVRSIVAYDCKDPDTTVSTISLVKGATCSLPENKTRTITTDIQIIQRKTVQKIEYETCLVEMTQLMHYCGMHAHIAANAASLQSKVMRLSKADCRDMIRYGTIRFGVGPVIQNIGVNAVTDVTVTHVGSFDGSTCAGGSYVDARTSQHYESVFVLRSYRFYLTTGSAIYSRNDHGLTLPDGIKVKLSSDDNAGFHPTVGYVYPSVDPVEDCSTKLYETLYTGPAKMIVPIEGLDEEIARAVPKMVVVEGKTNKDLSFAIQMGDSMRECRILHHQTEHPDIYVVQKIDGVYAYPRGTLKPEGVNFMAYINSKFTSLEKRIGANFEELRDFLLAKICSLEEEQVETILALAKTDTEEFAYRINGNKPGVTAIISGEVAHVLKCVPVTVSRRSTEGSCWNALPVSYDNNEYFVSSRTRILMTTAAVRDCNPLTPSMYLLGGEWVSVEESEGKTFKPESISITRVSSGSWSYKSLDSMVKEGIYTSGLVEKYRRNQIFPEEAKEISMGNAVSYHNPNLRQPGGTFFKGLGDDNLSHLRYELFWYGVDDILKVGSAIGLLWGLYLVIRCGSYILDTVINCRALHTISGCGFHLLFGMCMSCTYLYTLVNTLLGGEKGKDLPPNISRRHQMLRKSQPPADDGTSRIDIQPTPSLASEDDLPDYAAVAPVHMRGLRESDLSDATDRLLRWTTN